MLKTYFIGLPALICMTILMVGCDQSRNPNDSTTEWIDPKKLKPGPIQHANLNEKQMARIQYLQKIFSEVDPTPIEKWVEDFQRDLNPDTEIGIWENMAKAYETFTTSRKLTPAAKQDVFGIVLLRSGSPEAETLEHVELKELSEQEAKEILRLFTAKPKPITVVPR